MSTNTTDNLRAHYEATGTRDLKEFRRRVKHLDRVFAGWYIAMIGQPDVDAYVVARRRKQAAGGTIRRELGTLTKMLRLAYQNGKLARLPIFHKPKEAAPRGGFFEWPQYEAVRRRLAPDLQVAVTVAYTLGWRMQSEVLALERRHLDLGAGTLRLDPGMAKNDEGRVVYLTPELRTLLGEQLERVTELERSKGRIVPWLFPHLGPRLVGQRIRDFRKAWTEACTGAGVPGAYRHDFRADRGAESRQRGGAGAGRDDDHRAQDAQRVRSVPHREPGGPAGGRPAAGGPGFWA